jgi:hypothetical protein
MSPKILNVPKLFSWKMEENVFNFCVSRFFKAEIRTCPNSFDQKPIDSLTQWFSNFSARDTLKIF